MRAAAGGIGAGETEPAGWLARGVDNDIERGWSVLTDVSDHFGFAPLGVGGRGETAGVPLQAGSRLGDVTIVRMLGEGGMGRVYEGLQDGPRRSVAVKVLAAGVLTRSALRRFEFEAEALGRLRHPCIAQIHSFGSVVTPLGAVPYFVMELVEGARTITEHASFEGLTVGQRAALVRSVAEAVAHGHAHGIIHRDLKPANILVDAAGAPKVIDFGVACSTDTTPGPDATATGDVVGTLQYMAPEQLGAVPGGIDVRTDVYALGLVLHELLVGRLPHDLRSATPGEAARRLLEAGSPAAAVEAAVRRAGHTGPGQPSALAVIVDRCLHTRQADRYATAHDVAAELGRWLAGEPIEARPPRWTESAVRFARRHRSVVWAAAVVLAVLVSAVAVTSWFSLRSLREWRRADASRLVAEAREREAAARAATARRDLFRANVLLSAQARDHGSLAEAWRALEAARGLLASVNESEPIEFTCLEASLDDAVAVVKGDAGAVTSVAAVAGRIAMGTEQGGLRIVSPDSSEDPLMDRAGHQAAIWGSSFAPDGSRLATASADGTVHIWDTTSGACVATLDGHGSARYAVAFSPDGDLLATAGRDGTILVHDTDTWRPVTTLSGHEGTVYTLAFSPDGTTLASAGLDRILRLWDLATATERVRLSHHEGRIFRVAFAADGILVATADEAGCTRIVSVATGHTRAVLRHPQRVNGVVFLSADEVATGSADGLLRVWNVGSGTECRRYRGHLGGIWDVAIDPQTGLVSTAGADGTVRCWNVSKDLGPELSLAGSPSAGVWLEGGSRFAVAGDDAAIRSFSTTTFRERGLRNAGGPVTALAATHDGDLVACGDESGQVRIWRQGVEAVVIDAHPRTIHAVACRADGAMMATAAEDRTARLFDTRTGTALTQPLRHPRRVLGVALSASGDRLATACEDRSARVWSCHDATEMTRFTGHTGPVTSVAFDPGEHLLLTGSADATVRVWDLADGRCRMQLTGPTRGVGKVAWSPDGRRIAAAAMDGSVHVWDAADGSPTPVLQAGSQPVMDVAFAPDGRRLLTVTADRTVRVWGTSPAEIVRSRFEERE